jgi:integrase
MPLTDTKVRSAKPGPKTQKLFDQGGLYLEISPSGGKWWRWKYRFDGVGEDGKQKRIEKRLAIGIYPDVSLKLARERRDEARGLLARGIDPGEHRKAEKQAQAERGANIFEVIAREWFAKQETGWAESHSGRVIRALERDVFPWLGNKPIVDIGPGDLLEVMHRIEARGAGETAHRVLRNCSMIFRYGVVTGRCKSDPSRDLRGALAPVMKSNLAAATEPDELKEILRATHAYQGTLVVQCALRLAPLVFVRPGELRKAEWKDFDLGKAEWRYTVTKTGKPHIVPLASQAVEILRELHPLTGRGQYVFPSARSNKRPMSDNAVLAAMRRSDISKEQMTGHGFRAAARTILDEVLHFPADVIEHQLAHNVRDPLGRAYNRTTKLDERRHMMQEWADYLDRLRTGTPKVLSFPASNQTA